ncbi:MAG: YfcC family protein [Firmicutes bacterium]|nr:YfcC family protein [Bacillota bacterium]
MDTEKKKIKFKMPHAYVLIVGLVIIMGILTYIIPAGVYDSIEVNGKKVLDPNSFHFVDPTPVSPWNMVLAIPQGLVKQAGLIFMIIVISGSVEIINRTEALEASIGRLANKFRNRLYMVIPLLLACFVAMGAVGVGNSIVVFIPLGLTIAFGLGADALVGVALVGTGMNLGFTGGAFVAATTGTAQTISGIPVFSGFGFRLLLTVALWAFGCYYLIRYTKKLQKDPTSSILYGDPDAVTKDPEATMPELTGRRKLVLLAFIIGFAFIVYGAIKSWSANDAIPSIFLLTGIVCGLIYGFKPSQIASIFVEGAKKITFGALIVGVSAAISIVMTNGQIIHTCVHGLASLMGNLPSVLAGLVMYFVNIIINTFITSGSGQAAAVMPIMSPLASVIGIPQQCGVLAFQLGDGFTNQILPMSSVLMAGLAFGGISYGKWLKFFLKWLLANLIIGAVFLIIAISMNWGAIYG